MVEVKVVNVPIANHFKWSQEKMTKSNEKLDLMKKVPYGLFSSIQAYALVVPSHISYQGGNPKLLHGKTCKETLAIYKMGTSLFQGYHLCKNSIPS